MLQLGRPGPAPTELNIEKYMFEVCKSVEMLSTIIPLEDPIAWLGKARAFVLLLMPCAVKNASTGGHVPPGFMAGLVALVKLIPTRQPLLPVVPSTLIRQLLVGGMGEEFAAVFPMLKNIQSPDADEDPVLLISVIGEHTPPSLPEFMTSGVPTLFKTPAEVKLS